MTRLLQSDQRSVQDLLQNSRNFILFSPFHQTQGYLARKSFARKFVKCVYFSLFKFAKLFLKFESLILFKLIKLMVAIGKIPANGDQKSSLKNLICKLSSKMFLKHLGKIHQGHTSVVPLRCTHF